MTNKILNIENNLISKPRTFSDVEHLKNSVYNSYVSRLDSMIQLLNELSQSKDWSIDRENYLKLLKNYCNDVNDLLVQLKNS
jgi:hypothetical protein